VVEGIRIPWRDLPRKPFGPWLTVWKRHRRYAGDGTWDRVLQALLAQADAEGKIDWTVSIDATINRAHQHATNTTRPQQDNDGAMLAEVLADIRVPRLGLGRPRTTPRRRHRRPRLHIRGEPHDARPARDQDRDPAEGDTA
jgi:hypothetical protein